MIDASRIVPQRTRFDCCTAALATAAGWTYEKARTVLGPHTFERGTFLMPLATVLLPEGLAPTWLLSRENPQLTARASNSHWGAMLPSPAEIRRQIQGRRAIVIVPGRGPNDETGPEFCHAIAWDGHRAIHCGATPPDYEPAREISLEAVPPWEALILNEIPGPRPDPVEADPAPSPVTGSTLAGIFERHERAYLGFSGGKESIVLAHMLAPWRDRVSLVWVNTGFMAGHMVEFVRGFADRFDLTELASPDLHEVWRIDGIPADVAPFANVAGLAEPRFQPWLRCCATVRQEPVNAFLRRQPGSCCYVLGQRREDRGGATIEGLRPQLPASVEIAMPLADWSEADVFAYIARHDLTLPSQYAEGCPDSLECLPCPAQIWPARMSYLARRYPEALSAIRASVRAAAIETVNRVAQMVATAEATYPVKQDAHGHDAQGGSRTRTGGETPSRDPDHLQP